ncbi:hypothetical protein ACWEKT_15835 [Nocardia takedensis]
MNEPYSRRHARNAADNPPLAALYDSAAPIRWNGSMIYPLYSERLGSTPKLLTMALLSAAPPAGLRGQGIGLSMVEGYIALDGKRLGGVDVWSDALHSGVTFELTPTGPNAGFSLTPVWVDAVGVQKSWSGNYGILVEDVPDGRIALWCSIGEGPPNFANLVVALMITRAPERAPAPPEHAAPEQSAPDEPAPEQPTAERPTQPTVRAQDPSAVREQPEPYSEPASEYHPEPQLGYHPESQAQPEYYLEPEPHPEYRPPSQQYSESQSYPGDQRYPADQVYDDQRYPNERYPDPEPVAHPEPVREPDPPRVDTHLPPPGSGAPERGAGPDPGYRGALYDLGLAMYHRGEEEQACALWAQAASAGHAAAAYDLGVVRYRRGDADGAEHWWRTAADLRDIRAMAGLSELLDRLGSHAEAQMWRARAAEERAGADLG